MYFVVYWERFDVKVIVYLYLLYLIVVFVLFIGEFLIFILEVEIYFGKILIVFFRLVGIEELVEVVVEKIREVDVVFMERYGIVIVGRSFREVFYKVEFVEESVKLWYLSRK